MILMMIFFIAIVDLIELVMGIEIVYLFQNGNHNKPTYGGFAYICSLQSQQNASVYARMYWYR